MALTWLEPEKDEHYRRQPIDWVGVYVWGLIGSSVLLALAVGAWAQ